MTSRKLWLELKSRKGIESPVTILLPGFFNLKEKCFDENALKNFFDRFPKFSDFDFAKREVKPGAPIGYMVPTNNTAITFEEVLRSADEKGFQIPRNYILVDQKPDILPNTPPPTTTEKPKIGIGWILLGIAVGGIVLYKIAKILCLIFLILQHDLIEKCVSMLPL